jgi:hypothetical protein
LGETPQQLLFIMGDDNDNDDPNKQPQRCSLTGEKKLL